MPRVLIRDFLASADAVQFWWELYLNETGEEPNLVVDNSLYFVEVLDDNWAASAALAFGQ